jgi:hypothetical protein
LKLVKVNFKSTLLQENVCWFLNIVFKEYRWKLRVEETKYF